MSARLKVAVIISGGGSNLKALIAAAAQPDCAFAVTHVICNRPDAGGLAHAAGILDEIEGGGRRIEPARLPAEQRRAEGVLQLADMAADGGLAEAEPVGGGRQRSRVDHGEEGAEEGPVEHGPIQK